MTTDTNFKPTNLNFPLYLARMQVKLLRPLLLIAVAFATTTPNSAHAQYALDYGFAAGTGNYLGDIGGAELTRRDFAADLHLNQTRLSTHFFVRYRLSSAFAVRAQLGSVFIQDHDNQSTNRDRRTRNAHFRNTINELSLRGEVNLVSLPMITRYTSKVRVGFNSYAIMGVTAFTHNPQARIDEDAHAYLLGLQESGQLPYAPSEQINDGYDFDQWHSLREKNTEGANYGLGSVGFPMGLGASFVLNYQVRIGVEFVWNLTLTDHLDDVSNIYADPSTLDDIGFLLSQPASPASATAGGAEDVVGHLTNYRWHPSTSSPRGNPDKNDTYGTLQVTVSKVVRSQSNFRKNNNYGKRRTVKRKPTKPGSRGMGRGRAKF